VSEHPGPDPLFVRKIAHRALSTVLPAVTADTYANLLAALPNAAIALFDNNLRLVLFRGRALAEVGLQPDMLEGRLLGEVLPARAMSILERLCQRALKGKSKWLMLGCWSRIYEIHLTPLSARSTPFGMAVWLDVTQRELTRQVLEQQRNALDETQAHARKLAGRLLTVQDTERRRIARDLHDDIGQRLIGLASELAHLKRGRPPAAPDWAALVGGLADQARQLCRDLRTITHELHPAVLEYFALPAAVASLCESFSEQTALQIELTVDEAAAAIAPKGAACLYRVLQEGLRNIVRHAGVANAQVRLQRDPDYVTLTISDNGCGFKPGARKRNRGLGIVSMQERIKLLGGRFRLQSSAATGTEIVASVPGLKRES